ncbi:serine O-acetyltransferase [Rhodanobacter geophilus]|uniref:Serine acetyltransferase n=1 Tax=Rhodanobacter geophilus TaxID=3162488 RepID=A0ABV3QR35_9GAMM
MAIWYDLQQDVLVNTGAKGNVAVLKALLVSHSVKAIFRYRLSRALLNRGAVGRLVSKWLWLRNIRLAACHISPRACIGPGLCLPHAVGIVIGEGVVVGDRVTIYQHVTLGTSRKAGPPAYPCICDDVQIYANAVVFGAIVIGNRSVIGAGLVVSRTIPSNAVCRNEQQARMDVSHA